MDWYRKSVDETARALGTEAAVGLTGAEAAARLEKHGPNALKQAKKRALWQMYLAQLKDVMVLVLLAAALISGVLLGEWVDAGIILLVVLLNALLGVIQENRAEKSLEALKKLSSPHAKVRRDGEISSVPAADLVPGDVVLLEAGDYVSADLRLTVSAGLRVDESALTGESEPVEKHAETLAQEGDLPLGDRTNLAFSGSLVTYGRGEGIVVATGMDTQLGAIAGISLPNFWLGLQLMQIFAVNLRILPTGGLESWKGYILPSIAMGAGIMCILARVTRSSMIENLGKDYIRTARAKGLPEHRVIMRHAFKNSLIQVVTILGLQIGGLLSGSVITENIFSIPGMGRLLVDSISFRDYPVIQGLLMIFALQYVLINLVVDVLYGVINPKIRLD